MINFNEEQKACINAIDGVWVITASAGSGKTTVLVQRHLNMLSKGISSNDILNLTFTNSAGSEMANRTGLLDAKTTFRTFHSFALDLIKKERNQLSFKLCDTVIPVAVEDYQLLFDLVKIYPGIENYRKLKEKISRWKCRNIEPQQALEESRHRGVEYYYALAYEDYERKSREQGWLDFDSLMRETVKLLETNEEVRNRWRKKYIAVDEAQDTDICQFKLLTQIFEKNIFCVGDPSQSLYVWRSAQPDNLINFEKSFPGAKTLFLGKNYRSTKRLVSFFKKILPFDNGIASYMETDNEEGEDPRIMRYANEQDEAEGVLEQIEDPEKTAILARTNRQLFVFQRLCAVKGIKYKVLGKKDFWEQNEIKKLLKFAKESTDTRPADMVLADIIRRHNLIYLYRNTGDSMESDPVENLNSIVRMASGHGGIKEFLSFLRKKTYARKSSKGLTLSTVHQIKGSERDFIYIIGANEGKMPHKDGELGEERRIFYVAATRAAKFLYISYCGRPSRFIEGYLNK